MLPATAAAISCCPFSGQVFRNRTCQQAAGRKYFCDTLHQLRSHADSSGLRLALQYCYFIAQGKTPFLESLQLQIIAQAYRAGSALSMADIQFMMCHPQSR